MSNFLTDSFNWLTQLFRKNDQFYMQSSYMVGQKGAAWLAVDKPFQLYESIPQLHAIVNKKALMRANVLIELVDIKTNERVENTAFYKLMENPNPLQSQNDWIMQRVLQGQIYGNQFLYKNVPTSLQDFPSTLMNISPRYMRPYLTGKVFDQTELKEIIEYFEYDDLKGIKRYETDKILYTKLCDLDNPILGRSPLKSLKYPLTNIKNSYQYRNTIMSRMGAVGMLSPKNKDGMGAIPLLDKEKQRINEEYIRKNGIREDQNAILLTEASLEFTSMTFPTKQMMLFEEVDANTITICDTYGMNVNIFSNKNATYENVKQSIIQTYQDTIIPETDQDFQSLTKFILKPEMQKKYKIVGKFDHIPILKTDKKTGIEATKMLIEGLSSAVSSGILLPSQAKTIIDNELKNLGY
jgi:phage portal protein BeeE